VPIVVSLGATRTLGQLKARIADELARGDLAPQIALAIDDAITEAATSRFWFNEVRGLTFSTIAGQEFYGSEDIAALTEIDSLWITISGGRRNMREANTAEIDGLVQGSAISGEPYRYARYGGNLRFYPTPGQAYAVTVDGVSKLSAFSGDDDSNAWTDTAAGERLIRAIVKRNILSEIVQDFDRAKIQGMLAEKYKSDLLAQTYDRTATGQMAAHG
jgi:hypothetical protein